LGSVERVAEEDGVLATVNRHINLFPDERGDERVLEASNGGNKAVRSV